MAALSVPKSLALSNIGAGGGKFDPKSGIKSIGRCMLNYSDNAFFQERVVKFLREQNLTSEAKNNLERVLTKFSEQSNEVSKRENYENFVKILSEPSNFEDSNDQQKLETKLGKLSNVFKRKFNADKELNCGCLRNCVLGCD